MLWPSTQPSCLIEIQNGLVETDVAKACGLGTGPRPRIPTRAVFSDFCASTAGGAASTAPRPVTKARRFINPIDSPQCEGRLLEQFGQPLTLLAERTLAPFSARCRPQHARCRSFSGRSQPGAEHSRDGTGEPARSARAASAR